jgi:hypothetical protein
VHCVNTLRVNSSKSLFTTKSCSCASVACLAGMISLLWAVYGQGPGGTEENYKKTKFRLIRAP